MAVLPCELPVSFPPFPLKEDVCLLVDTVEADLARDTAPSWSQRTMGAGLQAGGRALG